MTADDLKDLLESVQSQIKNFDTKAQVILGLTGLITGLIGSEIPKGIESAKSGINSDSRMFILYSCAALAGCLISVVMALMVIIPRLKLGQPSSSLFWGHLVQIYGKDYKRADEALRNLDESHYQEQLTSQILVNANICASKSKYCLRAYLFLGISLVMLIVLSLQMGYISYKSLGTHGTSQTCCCVKD